MKLTKTALVKLRRRAMQAMKNSDKFASFSISPEAVLAILDAWEKTIRVLSEMSDERDEWRHAAGAEANRANELFGERNKLRAEVKQLKAAQGRRVSDDKLLRETVLACCRARRPIKQRGYVGWHNEAERRIKAGWKQRRCPGCKLWTRWFYPSEGVQGE